MTLSEAIAAAQQAGNTTAQQIYDWLFDTTETLVDSGATITHSQVVELLGLEATASLLASLQAASASNAVAAIVLTLLTTGGYVRTGTDDIAANLTAFVSAGLLTEQQASVLRNAGLRPQYRFEAFGLPNLPTRKQIQSAM